MDLRDEILKLAHEVPEMRKHLIPLLKQAGTDYWVGRSKLPEATILAVNIQSIHPYAVHLVEAEKRLKAAMSKLGGKYGPIHYVQLLKGKPQLACKMTNGEIPPEATVLSGGTVKAFEAATRKPPVQSSKTSRGAFWFEVLIAAKSTLFTDWMKAVDECKDLVEKVNVSLKKMGDEFNLRNNSHNYQCELSKGGCEASLFFQYWPNDPKELVMLSDLVDDMEKLKFDVSQSRKRIQLWYEVRRKKLEDDTRHKAMLLEAGVDHAEHTGGCNLGRCYNSVSYKVYPLPGHKLTSDVVYKLIEEGALPITLGQSTDSKVNPDGSVDLNTKIDSGD